MKSHHKPHDSELQLTPWWADGEGNRIARLLDEVDNVAVVEGLDVHPIDSQNTVANIESSTTLCWAAFNDTACKWRSID